MKIALIILSIVAFIFILSTVSLGYYIKCLEHRLDKKQSVIDRFIKNQKKPRLNKINDYKGE